MSAGDVKFIGWTGGTPNYKELSPTVSHQPVRTPPRRIFGSENTVVDVYVLSRVTRRLLCFTKDKDDIIAAIPDQGNVLSLTYIDDDGTVQTKSYGGGWAVLTIDDSPAATGFSNLNITYSKAQPRAVVFPGVDGLSIDCASGVCRIRYNENTIESIDSGTGVCGDGLSFNIENIPLATNAANEDDIAEINSAVAFRVSVLCNGIISDKTEITGGDLPRRNVPTRQQSETLEPSTFTATYATLGLAQIGYNDFRIRETWSAQEVAAAIEGLRLKYPDTANITHTITIKQTASASYRFDKADVTETGGTRVTTGTNVTGTITRVATIIRVASIPVSAYATNVLWSKSGNTLTLSLSVRYAVGNGSLATLSKTIRQYDVTGLT